MANPAELLADPRFSRIFELPADPQRGRPRPFRVQYADIGFRDEDHPERENVILFFGPLMGSRLFHIAKDALAKRHRIRIIHPDRPGFGGTDRVEPKDRLGMWLEVIPALLTHLSLRYVSVACHSTGTVYGLDFVLHRPEFLHPTRPYLAIAGPWILPVHTGMQVLSLAQRLPVALLNQTDKTARLINNHLGPAIGAVGGFSLGMVATLRGETAEPADPAREESDDRKFEMNMWNAIITRVYAEGVQGLSDDTVLVMQRHGPGGWGDWGDYDKLVPRLVEALQARGMGLRVDVYYAVKDNLIGGPQGKGAEWFIQCWRDGDPDGVVQFHSRAVDGVDHDSIWSCGSSVVKEVFERISGPAVVGEGTVGGN